jgi:hypothetical protein
MKTTGEALMGRVSTLRKSQGLGFSQIADMLNREGYRSPTGKRWTPENLRVKFHKESRGGKRLRKPLRASKISRDAVRRIVELYSKENRGWEEIVQILTAEGHQTASGRPWSIHNARKVFDQRDQILSLDGTKALVPLAGAREEGGEMEDINEALARSGDDEDGLRTATLGLFGLFEKHLGRKVHGIARKGDKLMVSYEMVWEFDLRGSEKHDPEVAS